MANDAPNSWLPIEISEIPIKLKNDSKGYIDEDIWESNAAAKIGPLIGIGSALFLIITSLWSNERLDIMGMVVFYISCTILCICMLYYFTMPNKKLIFDRKHGTITFPGTLWNKNITMPFNKVKFCFSTGGHNMVGAYKLELIKPETLPKRYGLSFWGTYSEDLSLLTWYMDRNRPLPPGSLFDPFRKRDFERRKAEGFPPPL